MEDLAARLANRVQLTTDGHKMYLNAVPAGFGTAVDYAMLIKLYGGRYDELGARMGDSTEVIGAIKPAVVSLLTSGVTAAAVKPSEAEMEAAAAQEDAKHGAGGNDGVKQA